MEMNKIHVGPIVSYNKENYARLEEFMSRRVQIHDLLTYHIEENYLGKVVTQKDLKVYENGKLIEEDAHTYYEIISVNNYTPEDRVVGTYGVSVKAISRFKYITGRSFGDYEVRNERDFTLKFKVTKDDVILDNFELADEDKYAKFLKDCNEDIAIVDKNGKRLSDGCYVKYENGNDVILGWINGYNKETKKFTIKYWIDYPEQSTIEATADQISYQPDRD